MKEIIKTSVAGYHFSFEKEAYDHLENYLEGIRKHFEGQEGGAEIVADIEERISELLRLDIGQSNRTATLADVQHLTAIMGQPEQMDENGQDEGKTAPQNSPTPPNTKEAGTARRKLYRDMENAKLGGVLSGLGHFFGIDSVWLRVAFTGLAALGIFGNFHESDSLTGYLVLAYLILWVCLPGAKTIGQKLAMTGRDASIADIEAGNKQLLISGGSSLGKTLVNVIRFFAASILLLMGFALLAGFGTLFASKYIFLYPSFSEFFEVAGFRTSDFYWGAVLIIFGLGSIFIYGGILLFGRGKNNNYKFFLVGLASWFLLLLYLSTEAHKEWSTLKAAATSEQRIEMAAASDTVHVRLGDDYKLGKEYRSPFDTNATIYIHGHLFNIFSLSQSDSKHLFLAPKVDVEEDTMLQKIEVVVEKGAFAANKTEALQKAREANFDIRLQDTAIVLNPAIFDKKSPWDKTNYKIVVKHPAGKTIVLDDRLK